MSAQRSLLEEVLPCFDAREVHDIWVPAPPQVVFAAVKQVTVGEVRLLLPLERLRALPGVLAGRRTFRPSRSAPLLDQFTANVVPLGERPDAEIAAGAVGRFWHPAGGESVSVRTADDFVSFAEPGYAKAAIAFLVRPEDGGTRVITETRVAGTSPEATRAFMRYWLAIRVGSGVIRRSWLAAIRRRAVRADGRGRHSQSGRATARRRRSRRSRPTTTTRARSSLRRSARSGPSSPTLSGPGEVAVSAVGGVSRSA
jgi:hypothetical protein